MRNAFVPRSRVAVLAVVPTTSEGRLASAWRRLMNVLFDPYRPELHYMRGPGPKWRQKCREKGCETHGITQHH